MQRRAILERMRGQANRSQRFLLIIYLNLSTIVLCWDRSRARALQRIAKKSVFYMGATLAGSALLATLVGCDADQETQVPAEDVDVVTANNCDENSHLAAELYGSIERVVDWSSHDVQCESMLRPDGEGIRIRLTGDVAGKRVAFILALPSLDRGQAANEVPTIVTFTVEGSGRFFSTPNLESCWTDVASQSPRPDDADQYEITGKLYCVSPLGEINGDAAVSIPELSFRSVVDWGAG